MSNRLFNALMFLLLLPLCLLAVLLVACGIILSFLGMILLAFVFWAFGDSVPF